MSDLHRRHALQGALIADAAAMGLHWIYDQQHIAVLASAGDVLFRQPDAAHYKDRKAYFAHGGRRAGELSHYGESARIVGKLALCQGYTPSAHREAFMQSFGPCGSFCGYADVPTRALVLKMLSDGEMADTDSGADDDQMPGLCVVPGLFAADASLDTVLQAVRVISVHEDAQAAAATVFNCMNMLLENGSMHDALVVSAKALGGALGSLLLEALELEDYQPLAAARQFGMACQISQGLPVIWHILLHADDFASAVRDNILCGGDSCGRAMALGAIAGLHHGVPRHLADQLAGGILAI